MASSHEKLKRVRKPRVHITYDVETGGAQVERELPFVVGVLGDFSGNPEKPMRSLKERKFIQIDRDNFDDVMGKIAPELNLKVANTIADDGSTMPVKLKFNGMSDFDPAMVAKQIEPLRQLLEARSKLNDLMTKIDRSEDLEALIEQVLQNPGDFDMLCKELGIGQANEEPAPPPAPEAPADPEPADSPEGGA